MSLGRHGTFAAAVEVPECLLGDMALFAAAVEVLECLLGGMVLFSAVVRPWGRVVCRSASLEAWHSMVAAAKPIGGSVEAPAWLQGGMARPLRQPLGPQGGGGQVECLDASWEAWKAWKA